MHTLVTGAAGFIGAYVAARLGAVGLDNYSAYYDPQFKQARVMAVAPSVTLCRLDITDHAALEGLFQREKFTHVVHLAAQPGVRHSIEHPRAYIDANIVGFLNVLECCRHHGIEHLVYASSSSVYGANAVPFSVRDGVDRPLNLYAATKKANELMAHAYSHLHGFATTGLRFFTVYGPWGRPDMAPIRFARALLAGEPLDVYNHGQHSRDFTYIDDIVDGVVAALEQPNGCQVHNIGRGEPISLLAFIEHLAAALGVTPKLNFLPAQPGDMAHTWAEMSIPGYQPRISLADGVVRFARWYQNYYEVTA